MSAVNVQTPPTPRPIDRPFSPWASALLLIVFLALAGWGGWAAHDKFSPATPERKPESPTERAPTVGPQPPMPAEPVVAAHDPTRLSLEELKLKFRKEHERAAANMSTDEVDYVAAVAPLYGDDLNQALWHLRTAQFVTYFAVEYPVPLPFPRISERFDLSPTERRPLPPGPNPATLPPLPVPLNAAPVAPTDRQTPTPKG